MQDQRENLVSEVLEARPDATEPKVQLEKRETRVNAGLTDQSDHKEKKDQKVSQDHPDSQDPKDPKVIPVVKDPRDRKVSREDGVRTELLAKPFQEKRE